MTKKAVKKSSVKKSASRDTTAEILPGIVFLGCGMTQEKTNKFAEGIRRKLSGGK